MSESVPAVPAAQPSRPSAAVQAGGTAFGILASISVAHMLNDIMQSVIPSIYPILKAEFALDFGQIGLIQLAFQLTASLLQPAVGILTDRRPQPFSLAAGMAFTFVGLMLLSMAATFASLIVAVCFVGVGSSIFHPEASRVARMASGGRHGFAQSLFQVGGNFGSAVGPVLAVLIILGHGKGNIAWFGLLALVGMLLLTRVGFWYRNHPANRPRSASAAVVSPLPRSIVVRSVVVLALLIFSKFFYMAALTSYYTFYLIDTFGVTIGNAQLLLFVFLAAVAAGTFAGGPIGDRFGRKFVIWFSIVGILPMTLLLPYVGLTATVLLTIAIGLVLSSAFSAILVYAQELMPGKIGLVSGVFFGFAFGMGGIGAAALGELADLTSVGFMFKVVGFLPLIGLLTILLPDVRKLRA